MPVLTQMAFAVLMIGLSYCSVANAQIIMLQRDGDKTIECMHTGFSSNLNDCGTQSDWYQYVFVGTISAITPTEDGEKQLQITPNEIFKGNPSNPLTVRTSQGACFHELQTGSDWLFYLRKRNPIVLDFYGNISKPVAEAQSRLDALRRLKTIGDSGIVQGRVKKGAEGDPVPAANVVAHRATDDAQFVATTDTNGFYDFRALPPGKYQLVADPVGSFHADVRNVELKAGECWNLTITSTPHGRIAGHVMRSDGSAAQGIAVLIEEQGGYTTLRSDPNGYFHLESEPAGTYVVGINLPNAGPWRDGGCSGAGCSIPKASLYYPGVRNRADAIVINLSEDEKRDDIDFIIPVQ